MSYLLEWVAGTGADKLTLVRQVRAFRNGNGLKAFLHSSHFRRHSGNELRIQVRRKDLKEEQVIASLEDALNWDPSCSRLPPQKKNSNWERDVTALTLRYSLLYRFKAELAEAKQFGILNEEQSSSLIEILEGMLFIPSQP